MAVDMFVCFFLGFRREDVRKPRTLKITEESKKKFESTVNGQQKNQSTVNKKSQILSSVIFCTSSFLHKFV